MSLSARLLAPLAALYGAAVRRRNRRLDAPENRVRASVPVVSIGNLSAGGTGKTPFVGWLAARLGASGERVAIVSRGYGGRAGRGPLVVSRGEGPVEPANVAGDEPWMLARRLAGTIVVVGSDRPAGAAAAARLGATAVLLDDGFQHRALERDLDVVLLDATRPFWRDRLLPAGRLREPVTSLARADRVVITRSSPDLDAEAFEARLREAGVSAPCFFADHRACGFFDAADREVDRPSRVVAFCAIGNPARFRGDLEELGCRVEAFHALRDHRPIPERLLARWVAEARRRNATPVTTEKDLARLGRAAEGAPLVVLRIETVVRDEERLLEDVRDAIASARR